MERLTPDPEQEAAIKKMVASPTSAALNASLYGTGKTLVTVEIIGRLGHSVNLIAAPKNTRYSWEHTIKRQYPDVDVYHIRNDTKDGRAASELFQSGHPGWYIIGRELLLGKNMAPLLEKPINKYVGVLAFDECQSWSNRKSQGFGRIKKFNPQYKLALSATPFGNKFQNLWAIVRWLWGDVAAARSFWVWVREWCKTAYNPFTPQTPDVVGEAVEGAFVSTLPTYVRLEADFGEPMHEEIVVALSAKERKIYDTLKKQMIVWLGENPLILKFPHTLRMRLRQISLGEVTVTDEDVVDYPLDMKSTKLDTLFEIINEIPDEPMLVLTHSKKFAKVVEYRMQEAGLRAFSWTGDTTEKQREKIKQFFIDGDIDYIIATPGAIGEGTDGLQHRARVMVWLSRDENGMLNEQAFRRLYRRGQERRVLSIDIVAEDTYDRGQLDHLIEQAINNNRILKG